MRYLFLTVMLLLFSAAVADADEYRPAYLELQQASHEVYHVLWKVPARSANQRLGLYVQFPDDVKTVSPMRTSYTGNAFVERSSIRRAGGLSGTKIIIQGLERVSTDVLVRIHRLDGSSEIGRLNAANTTFTVAGAPQQWDVIKTYLHLGIEHILEGTDHLLFVACLILIAGTWQRILLTITGFTIAHSITLTLASLEVVYMPVPPIEVLIALSIVFLAREIAHDRRDTLTWRYPIIVSSTFGLLHGFGFASALRDIGLPQTEIPAALLSFNVGVEIGQLLFVASMLLIFRFGMQAARRLLSGPVHWFHNFEKPAAYLVGGITMFWVMERMSGFWA